MNNFEDMYMFGFQKIENKILFEKLLKIKNIGIKTATNILNNIDYQVFLNYLKSFNITSFINKTNISSKLAEIIFKKLSFDYLDLKINNNIEKNILLSLTKLGYNRINIFNIMWKQSNFINNKNHSLDLIVNKIITELKDD